MLETLLLGDRWMEGWREGGRNAPADVSLSIAVLPGDEIRIPLEESIQNIKKKKKKIYIRCEHTGVVWSPFLHFALIQWFNKQRDLAKQGEWFR